jgi:hypothetical protein
MTEEEERMPKQRPDIAIHQVIMLGAVWGLAEAALGLGLQKYASLASGSIMTGIAFFFIAAVWVVTRRVSGLALAAVMVTIIKLFDAFLLSLPIRHGAVANPIFAFWTEALAFLFMIFIIKDSLVQKKMGRAILGAASALVAVNLFPLVKYATGIPACVVAVTGYPLSLYYAPYAIGLSLITVPLGFMVGGWIAAADARQDAFVQGKVYRYLIAPAAAALCFLIIVLIRLAG